MIAIRNLSYRFPETGFQFLVSSLNITAKSHVAIVGPSGSGKTTILNLMAGILVPDSGEVIIGDHRISTLSDAERRMFRLKRIGFVFQNFDLINYLSVENNICVAARLDPNIAFDQTLRERAQELAYRVGVGHKLKHYPDTLSQGEKQRVAIARALLLKPQVILADEATGNLDPYNKRLILDLLFSEAHKGGATLVAVTHDHELLDRFDRVIDFHALVSHP